MSQTPFPKAAETTQQRRGHIARAATQVIASEGMTALSVRSVAKKAGCSRGLVEHYFGNKASLLIAANDWADEQYLDRVDAAVGSKSGLDALEIRLRQLLPYNEMTLDEWRVRIAFWHQGVALPSLEKSRNRSFKAVYNALLSNMQQAQELGEIADEIPLLVSSELLLFTVIGLCTSCLSNPKLRAKKPLDRRMKMFLGFLKTGNVAALEVGDPEKDY